MPIQIRDTVSIAAVEQKLLAFETRYKMSSAEFVADTDIDNKVPEFDAIEWDFLLMQKSALEEDEPCLSAVFSSRCKSEISNVNILAAYDDVAA
jgi:hypothetical protein